MADAQAEVDALVDEQGQATGFRVEGPLADAEGGLGTIFTVVHDGRYGDQQWLYKEYRLASLATHLRHFLAHLGHTEQAELRDYIPARPHQLVHRSGTAHVGLVMHRLDGVRLNARDIRAAPLSRRLRWSVQLAVEIGILHAHGIVHGDINEPNILIDGDTLHVIDIDTCGVLAPDRSDFLPHLRPQVRGKDTDPWLLASAGGEPPMPSVQTDLCYLTGMLHALLVGPPLSPLRVLGKSEQEIRSNRLPWPPDPDDVSPQVKQATLDIRSRLTRLDPVLQGHFRRLLDRDGAAEFRPGRAVSAFDWARDLHVAWQSLFRCVNADCANFDHQCVLPRAAPCAACGGAMEHVPVS